MLFQDPSGFVHQHLAPSMGIDMKSYVDYPNQHCRHQHERQSPEHRSSCDPRDLEPQLPPRPPKRKSEQHHHYIERERDRDRESSVATAYRRPQRRILNRWQITITRSSSQYHPGVPVHRCVLSVKSSFFKNVFSAKRGSMTDMAESEQRILMTVDEGEKSMHVLSWCLKNVAGQNSKDILVLLHAKPPEICVHSSRWHRYSYGEFSFAVVQANEVIEDHSQVETSRDATFIGVYDGHGGHDVSRFINDHLFLHLMIPAPDLDPSNLESQPSDSLSFETLRFSS
ncbi:hypothetical protein TB2_002626 [Malus domestica]